MNQGILNVVKQEMSGPNRIKDIRKNWQEYPEALYKKDLHNPDNHDGMNTHKQEYRSKALKNNIALEPGMLCS